MSNEINRKLSSAAQALSEGRLTDTDRLCKEILNQQPGNIRARVLAGRSSLARRAAAAACYQLSAVVERDPRAFTELLTLCAAERKQGNGEAALNWTRKATTIRPDDLDALWWRGVCALDLKIFNEAEEYFERAIDIDPENADLHDFLGFSVREQGRFRESIPSFERAVELAPKAGLFRLHLAEALMAENEMATAINVARELTELYPEDVVGRTLLAQCLSADGQARAAESEILKAVERAPHDGEVFAAYGSVLMSLGKIDGAVSQSAKAIELEPRLGIAYFNIVRSRKISDSDRPFIENMMDISAARGVAIGQKALFAYAAGKAFEDLGEYETAMRHYDEANLLEYRRKYGEKPFDMDINLAAYENIKRRFDPTFPQLAQENSMVPIFVFGMMRSGTTLMEQILSSHPQVGGAGEQSFWIKNHRLAFPEGKLHMGILGSLRTQYLDVLNGIVPEDRFVVDKMPTNYMQAGLLHLAFPKAKMIHIRRHPVDTCLSVYVTQNRVRIPWAHNKENIALNYRRYQDLMRYWNDVLPAGRILEIQYEDLVVDPRLAIEKILDHCGLPWSDSCLHHEANDRGVATPSLWQVRQPIYRTSVSRWQRFEPWLGELASLN